MQASPSSIHFYVSQIKAKRAVTPTIFQADVSLNALELLFRVFDLDERDLILFIVDVLTKRFKVDLYQRLKLSELQGLGNKAMQTNFMIQSGLLAMESSSILEEDDSAKVTLYSNEIKVLIYRLLLKALDIPRSSLEMIQFFRKGNFKASNRQFDETFLSHSKLMLVEEHEDVYI